MQTTCKLQVATLLSVTVTQNNMPGMKVGSHGNTSHAYTHKLASAVLAGWQKATNNPRWSHAEHFIKNGPNFSMAPMHIMRMAWPAPAPANCTARRATLGCVLELLMASDPQHPEFVPRPCSTRNALADGLPDRTVQHTAHGCTCIDTPTICGHA